MKQTIIHGFIIFALAFLFMACGSDDDPTGPGSDGSFSVTITGDVNAEFTGFSWFWSGAYEEEQAFWLWFASEEDEEEASHTLWFAREGGTRPGTGSVVIGNYENVDEEGWNPNHLFAWYNSSNGYFRSVSGTMNVSTSTDNRFAGSFQLTATGFTNNDWENEQQVTISGTFDAIGGNIPLTGF
jgi:hypothetical protein